ncbi:Vegetative incompatibility protein HET-E-1 [Beauveria bassiana]|uniref:Vegetative incompatibility protein HET-E-1 n=1 Tax=Beauveria bassiana TaxID=176275 RepID=A0A2N6NHC0_BEABA|nr:Vegetative incompatibility protein HET-E-1 [Beauveria bassiana]
MISQEPLQTYGAALTFCPNRCKMKESFWGSQRIPLLKSVKGIENDWDFSLIQVLWGHTASISAMAFSCDGTLASASMWNGTVIIWDLHTGREAKVLCKDLGSISDIAFSYDGKQLAAVWEKGNVRLWNLLTGEEANMHTFHSETVRALEFSRDGTLASASDDRTVRIWDPAKTNTMKILSGHTDWVFAIAFSHDGKQLASASKDDTVRLWDAAKGSELRLFEGFRFGTLESDITGTLKSDITFMADGKDLLLYSFGYIVRLNVDTGAKTPLLNSQTSFIIELWDLKTGDVLQGLRTACYDRTIRLWDSTMTSTVATSSSDGLTEVAALAFSPNGEQLASGFVDGSIRVQNSATGMEIVPRMRAHPKRVTTLVYSPDGGQLASVPIDGPIKLWDTAAGYKIQRSLDSRGGGIRILTYSSDGKQIVSVSYHGAIVLWDPATGLGRLVFDTRCSNLETALSLDGQYIASAGDKTLKLWDLDKDFVSPVWCQTVKHEPFASVGIVFSPDAKQIPSTSTTRRQVR